MSEMADLILARGAAVEAMKTNRALTPDEVNTVRAAWFLRRILGLDEPPSVGAVDPPDGVTPPDTARKDLS